WSRWSSCSPRTCGGRARRARSSSRRQLVAETGEDGMELVRGVDARGVDAPFLLGEDERMELLAADRSVAAGLVLEVDLLAVDECAERDHVAAVAKRVEANQLLEEDVGIVVLGEQRLDRCAAELALRIDISVFLSVARHQERGLAQRRDSRDELRMPVHELAIGHPRRAIREVDMRSTARHRHRHVSPGLVLRRTIGFALDLLDAEPG